VVARPDRGDSRIWCIRCEPVPCGRFVCRRDDRGQGPRPVSRCIPYDLDFFRGRSCSILLAAASVFVITRRSMNFRGRREGAWKPQTRVRDYFERIYWHITRSEVNGIGTLVPQTLDAFYQGGLDPNSPNSDFTQLSQSFPSNTRQPVTSTISGCTDRTNGTLGLS